MSEDVEQLQQGDTVLIDSLNYDGVHGVTGYVQRVARVKAPDGYYEVVVRYSDGGFGYARCFWNNELRKI